MTDFFCSISLSFSPNLHSGVPLRYALIRTWPSTSARNTAPRDQLFHAYHCRERHYSPSLLIIRLTVSMTSTNASFLRYLTSDRRHDVAPVACIVIFDESSRYEISVTIIFRPRERLTTAISDLMLSVVMYIFRVSISEF